MRWPTENPSALSGKIVRLRVHLSRHESLEPRLYAVYLRSTPHQ